MGRVAKRVTPPVLLAVAVAVAGMAVSGRIVHSQAPVFRATVDLVAVDVQVLKRDGTPDGTLGPDKFEVSIGGKKRHVVSADFVRSSSTDQAAAVARPVTSGPVATNSWPLPLSILPGRVFILAIDTASFEVAELPSVLVAARGFLQGMQPNDLVGLFVFPVGPKIDPTADHAAISRALNTVTGARASLHSQFNLTATEVIDITAELAQAGLNQMNQVLRGNVASSTLADAPVLQAVQQRECGDLTGTSCVQEIATEAVGLADAYEGQAVDSIHQLSALLRSMKTMNLRKTVIVVSGGMPSSDRPGAHADLGNLAIELGRDAAETNTIIYALDVDDAALRTFSAETRRIAKTPQNRERESTVGWQLLDRFAGASGGTMMRVLTGSGEDQFDRVLRETSAYYLLGVEPVDADRDGRTRELKVKVNESGVTVRSRMWVALPKKT